MIKKYNLTVRDYGEKGWYISDGRSNYLHCNGKIVNGTTLNGGAYLRKELAEQALETYNNKGEVMKRVSIEDAKGKVYEFETDRNIVLLKVVEERIIGYVDDIYIDPLTWSLKGTPMRGQSTIDLTPYDQFKDLKRVVSEGARIELSSSFLRNWKTLRGQPIWECKLEQYRIKGNISIEQWDKHKEVIKEFWKGTKVEYYECITNEWHKASCPSWSLLKYRVKPKPKVEELSIQQLENMLGYKIKIVKEEV